MALLSCRNGVQNNDSGPKLASLKDLQRESQVAYCLNRCLPESEALSPKAAVAKLIALGDTSALNILSYLSASWDATLQLPHVCNLL